MMLIEDNPGDVRLLKEILADSSTHSFLITHTDRLDSGLGLITKDENDVIVLDLNLPDSQGLDTLKTVLGFSVKAPVVVMSGLDDESLALEVHQGAQDYLVKGMNDGNRIARIVDNAIERHRLIYELQNSEARTLTIINNNVDSIIIVDRNGLMRFVNPSSEDLFGHPAKKMIGLPFGFPVEEGRVSELEIRQPNGFIHVAESRTAAITWENQPAFLVSLRDITERKQAEVALEKSNAFNESLLKTVPFGMDIVDEKGRILFLNQAMQNAIGKNGLGAKCWDVYKDDKSQCAECPLKGDIKIGETKKLETTGALGGHIFDISHTGIMYQGKKAVLEVFYDITELKNAQSQLQEYSLNLEEKVEERTHELQSAQEKLVRHEHLATIGQLAGSVGHELRNPLNVISASVYLLNKTLAGIDEKSQEYLDIIKQETDRSAKIIKDLLDFGRIPYANKEKAAVGPLISQALMRNIPPATIKVTSSDKLGTTKIIIDSQQIGQVLDNLINNAYQAMPAGGKLLIKTARQKGQLKISVIDTGTGISEEDLDRLFDPLFTTKARGIGLGLALSKNYVEANGGSIAVESEENKGSTFTISFKLNE
jgi:signal transduction histidine kinase/CheY-like chemotaxis protein